jgi:hypothetical protein
MNATTNEANYKDQRRLIVIIGVILLLGGIAIGFLGPLEMYCFYLFSEGGRFYYQGFGFGSFMFGDIASQIIGYYLLAALLIPLGYAHIKLRRWARTLSLTLLWSWLVVGAPLVVVGFLVLVASKDLSLPVTLGALAFLGLSYLVFPGLFIRFYQGRNVRRTFEARDAKPSWLEGVPIPILVLSSLYVFFIIMLHILILFNGIFPVFGVFVFGLQGILLLDISIACLVCLLWGTLRLKLWAWWVSIIWLGLFMLSTVVTFINTDYTSLLSEMAFPPSELEFLGGIPAQGYHFAILVGMPLFVTWVILLSSRRYFKAGRDA